MRNYLLLNITAMQNISSVHQKHQALTIGLMIIFYIQDLTQNVIMDVTKGDASSVAAFVKGSAAKRKMGLGTDMFDIASMQSAFIRNLEQADIDTDVIQQLAGAKGGKPTAFSSLIESLKDPDAMSKLDTDDPEIMKAIKAGFGETLGTQAEEILSLEKNKGETEKQFQNRRARSLVKVIQQFESGSTAEDKKVIAETQHYSRLMADTLEYLSTGSERERSLKALRSLGLVD